MCNKTNDKRKRAKKILVASMGYSCQVCGYDRCISSLDFHHVNPEEKKSLISRLLSCTTSKYPEIVKELKKCILLCKNCHHEFHEGIIKLPKKYAKLDESKLEELKNGYKNRRQRYKSIFDKCPVCGNLKDRRKKTCSIKCSNKRQNKTGIPSKRKMDTCWCGKTKPVNRKYCSYKCGNDFKRGFRWEDIDLYDMLEKLGTKKAIAEKLNVGESTVHYAFNELKKKKGN